MATTTVMTIDDLWQIEEPGRHNLIRGELHSMPPAGGEHSAIEATMIILLGNIIREQGYGRVYSGDAGFILSEEQNTVLSPDVAIVKGERLPPLEEQRGFLPLAPDFAVEIVSPSDRSSLVTEKVMEYLAAGTQLVWVVEPRLRLITAYTPDRDAHVYTADDEIDGGEVIPGFRIRVSEFFA
jgi:Uma2 family endonuclease